MTSIQSNYGLTAQGNQYKKATAGKNTGRFIGAAPGTVLTAASACILAEGKKVGIIGIGMSLGLTLLGGLVGKLLGGLIDNQTNKERMAQADGEAAREQHLSQMA